MSLKYEPFSEPLHISVKLLFGPHTLNPERNGRGARNLHVRDRPFERTLAVLLHGGGVQVQL